MYHEVDLSLAITSQSQVSTSSSRKKGTPRKQWAKRNPTTSAVRKRKRFCEVNRNPSTELFTDYGEETTPMQRRPWSEFFLMENIRRNAMHAQI